MVRLMVVFHQLFNVSLVTVEGESELVVDFDHDDTVVFRPPFGQHNLKTTGKALTFFIRGESIRISRIAFFGEPFLNPLPMNPVHLPSRPNVELVQFQTHWRPQALAHRVTLGATRKVLGIGLDNLAGVREVHIQFHGQKQGPVEVPPMRFVMPHGSETTAELMFTSMCKCKALDVAYRPTLGFVEPRLTGCFVDVSH
jgi:hypothetical protein